MDLSNLASQYLKPFNIMQLATSEDDRPWICTVHFYVDENLNFYWVSRTDRKHSQQIAKNPRASATVVIHENTPEENYVISVSASGTVEMLKDIEPAISDAYATKLNKPPHMLPNHDDPNNINEFYCLKPENMVVFDTQKFPDNPRQEWKIG